MYTRRLNKALTRLPYASVILSQFWPRLTKIVIPTVNLEHICGGWGGGERERDRS